MADWIPTVPSAADRTKITNFLNKFTAAERTAIWNHLQNDANALTVHMKTAKLSSDKFETDSEIITATDLAVSASLLTVLRKGEILNVAE